MWQALKTQTRQALVLVTLSLMGCSTPTPVTIKGAELAFKPIAASPKDTCSTQQQVAEHNSRLDSIKAGKPIVYKAPCDVEKNPEPKVS